LAASKIEELAGALETRLTRLADEIDGVVGYLVVDLTTGQRFARRADEPFPTASAIKIGILYELFAQVDAGKLALDEPRPLPAAARVGGAGVL
jgi:beta-lactamase class A